MKNLEATEIRGVSIRQLVTYVVTAVTFIIALVVRDVKRENLIEGYKTKIEAMEKQIEAAEKDRAAIKIIDNQQNERLTKMETKIDFFIETKNR
ncbi:MAG: hypothetical protein LC100_11300 [Chitinophagales bacterium]|nr:hypothetical protein [Chitinophagales bacterium]